MITDPETTDITLFVRTSGEEVARWNRRRIVEALIREAMIDETTAEAISREVEKQIVSSGISLLTSALIRELVDAKLIERGMEHAQRLHARLGFPLYDVRQLIRHQNKENANVPHAPEGTSLALVEGIKREYALHDVFSREVGDAHLSGDLHLHGLGYIDRPYSAFQSLEYLKRFGLKLPHSVTVAGPARHAEVLLAHMVRFGASLQGHFAGVIGWDAVNLSFAPYLAGMGERELEQFAQMLIYEFSQLTSSRGGQAIFTDIHLCWEVPDILAELPAVGPGGKPTGRTFREYGEDARRFARALMAVYREGDAAGKPFIFPRPIVHITDAFFRIPGHEAFLAEACGVAAAKGNPCFILDRERGARISPCGGADFREGTEGGGTEPWKRRCASIQNVTINLPRLGYRCGGDDGKLWSLLGEMMGLVAKAHVQKREFIESLLSLGDAGPLAMLAMQNDGSPYLRTADAACLIGMTGLDELVRIRRGKSLHESGEALDFGLAIVGHLREEADRQGGIHGMRFVLEQTPAETTAYRFARLDLKQFSPLPGRYVLGDLVRGEIYYTNSSHLPPAAKVDPATRIRIEGRFHPLFRAGAVTHIELGEAEPSATTLADMVVRAFRETQNNQIVFSPEFTCCDRCGSTMRGLHEKCKHCGSEEVDGLARITQYYSRVSGWNRGKRAELRDRNRNRDGFPAGPLA
ncbi:MAG: anaerobic ribonucleoside-triphosphate reductase [Proteobacteria bacterium]|nr:anaerobic ribonucleoside-triphosphate reductase [Pseudomonadota bacterium]MBU4582166.1 anaerobic ribonucleoside-triphosphate reductase [Pseudomonadota bacterium]MCG2742257.1 anaerobic ribonucleoside-triphosphate reductase [Syntrophaceae bacterium]